MKLNHLRWCCAVLTCTLFAACSSRPHPPEQDDFARVAEAPPPDTTSQPTSLSQEPPVPQARIMRVPLAPALYEVAYSPSQQAVFVVSAGGFDDNAPPSEVFRLNPLTLEIEARAQVQPRGFGIALDDQAHRLYIGQSLDAGIAVYDSRSLKKIGQIHLEVPRAEPGSRSRYTHHLRQLVLDTANHRLYAPGLSNDDSMLFVVDTRTMKLEKAIAGFGQIATGIALDPAGHRLFISSMRGRLFVVDTRSLTIRHDWHVNADQLLNLWWDADNQRLFATDQGLEAISQRRQKAEPDFIPVPGNRVVVFNPDDGRITASLPAGAGPITLLGDKQRHRLFVTNRGAGTVSEFDTRSLKLLQTIPLPPHPNSLAFDQKDNVLYVTIKAGRGEMESIARIAF